MLALLGTTTVGANTLSSPVVYTAEETLPEALNAPRSVDSLIDEYSLKYGVSASLMRTIIRKESTYNPRAIGDRNYYCKRTGQIAPSYGLAQINVCWHNVTIEQAFDPEFSVEFLAKHLSEGKCYLWSTCPQVYRN